MGSFLAYLQRMITDRLLREEEREPVGEGGSKGERRLPDKADFFFFYRCCWQKSRVGAVCSATLVRDRVIIGCGRE